MKRKKINNYFKELKKYNNSKFKNFLQYFNTTWLGERYPKKLRNYNDLILEENGLKKFHFTNNIIENINRYLNYELKMCKCSSTLFKKIILNIIAHFDNKNFNEDKKNRKSGLLKFYIQKNYNNIFICSNEEIENLKIIYEDIKFRKINASFCENNICDYDISEFGENSDIEQDEII